MPLDVFISYAHKDRRLRDELAAHLSTLRTQGVIRDWWDGDLLPGSEWEPEILERLNAAQIILLLISADFLVSTFCTSVELQQAIAKHNVHQARVIPIILRSVDWEHAPFAKLQVLPANGKPVNKWPMRDEAFKDIVKGIRRVIEDLDTQQAQTKGTFSHKEDEPLWNVPYQRNPFFTGREKLLMDLHDKLTQTSAAALTQRQAIHGLGGIGKTQTAIEYAYRYREEYTAVLWTSAATRDLLITSFVSLASLLNLAEKDAPDQTLTVEAVKGWLANHSGWLLILDNADDLAMASEFLPVGQTGHILLTTRAQAAGTIANSIAVESMDKQEGVHLLLKRAKVLLPDTSVDREAQSQAQAIVDMLGGLPLAIDQAGAYIEESGCSLAQYLAFYRTRRKELLRRRSGLPAEHPESVATTWSLSFQKVKEANLAASELLQVCAFLDADAIPEDLFTKGAKHLGKVLSPVASDPFQLNEAIQVLRQYSLIRRHPPTHTLSVHRLVQAVLQDNMTAKQQRQWTEGVIHALWEASPEVDLGHLSAYEPYLPHILHGATLIDDYHLSLADAASLLHDLGLYFYWRGRYTEVEPFYQRALKIDEQALGGEHPSTAATMSALASLYQAQGQYEAAEGLYQRALKIDEQALGGEHPSTATTMNQLARLYKNQGQYEQAQELYQRVLKIREQALGGEHPSTATTLHELASLYQDQGQYEAAEELYQRVLKITEQALGAEHPSTAATLHELASLYQDQGQYEAAEELYQRALKIEEQALGAEHPSTAATLHELARLYQAQGRYEAAEGFYQRALKIDEQALGAEHPQTAMTLGGLAMLYKRQGQYTRAEPLYRQALAIMEKVKPHHPHTTRLRESYHDLLRKME